MEFELSLLLFITYTDFDDKWMENKTMIYVFPGSFSR
jgi:hypothetical protein